MRKLTAVLILIVACSVAACSKLYFDDEPSSGKLFGQPDASTHPPGDAGLSDGSPTSGDGGCGDPYPDAGDPWPVDAGGYPPGDGPPPPPVDAPGSPLPSDGGY